MSQVKVFVTDRRTERQTDEWVLMSPAFAKGGDNDVLLILVLRKKQWFSSRNESYEDPGQWNIDVLTDNFLHIGYIMNEIFLIKE